MDRKKFIAAGGAAAAAAAVPAAALADAGGSAGQGLVGSWFGSVGVNGNPLPGFDDVISFLDGGVVIESRRYLLTPPGAPFRLLETTGQGAWKRTGNRTFEAFFRFLLQVEQSTDAFGTDNVRLTLTLDGDTLDGIFHSEVRATDGTRLDAFDGTWHGERITV
ncbi:MAG TPA: hypothetical protein VIU86_08110 [Gaiellaceae bacterium]